MRKPETQKTPRKHARQARAKRTVNAILEATARILKRDGLSKINTNFIALEANISVGSIYQYFPNKHAILLRLVSIQLEKANARRPAKLDEGALITLEERITSSVRWHLDAVRDDPLLFQRIFEVQREILSREERAEFDRYHEDAVYAGLAHHTEEISVQNLRTAATIVSQFLMVSTQSATARSPQLLMDAGYEVEIVRSLLSYLK